MRSWVRALSFGWPVWVCCLAAAQQPQGLNRVPPPIQVVVIPPPPYAMDSSVWVAPDLLLRVNEGLGSPGMNVYASPGERTAAPVITTNDVLLWGPYDLTVTEARSGWEDRQSPAALCRPPACWSPWPWGSPMDSMGGCALPGVDAPVR